MIGPVLPLAGEWTLESFCDHLAELDQWPVAAGWDMARRWRNWAFESAALDLALNQAGRALHEAIGRTPPPGAVRQLARPRRPAHLRPDPRAGSSATRACASSSTPPPAWTPALIDEVGGTGAVEIVDFKGHYGLDFGELPALLAMYERVIAAFPDALLEDAHDLPEVAALLAPEAGPDLLRRADRAGRATSTRRRSRRGR